MRITDWGKKSQCLRDLWDYDKDLILASPESHNERRRSRSQKVFEEILAENVLSLAKLTKSCIQEDKQTPNRINLKKSMPRHIITRLLKTKYKDIELISNNLK